MRSLALLAAALAAGCTLYPEDSGPADAGGSICNNDNVSTAEQLLDPSTLQCESFGTASCGPCTLCPQPSNVGIEIPDWGSCTSACLGLDEAACGQTSGCRLTYNDDAYWSMGTMGSASGYSSDFQGCYPVDTDPAPAAPCTQLDADQCAANAACAALYQIELCNSVGCDTPRFAGCVPVHQTVGSCTGKVACDLAISCPSGTTPGISGLCYTGACIPNQFCGQPAL
jgi:hypothetical protein